MPVFCFRSQPSRRSERLPFPGIERSSEPYRRALSHLADVTRDVVSPAARDSISAGNARRRRVDFRAAASPCSARFGTSLLVHPLRAAFYFWEIVFVSAILQLGMLPPLAYYFHRVTLAGPLANVPALVLTGLAVPLGFLTLAAVARFSRGLQCGWPNCWA